MAQTHPAPVVLDQPIPTLIDNRPGNTMLEAIRRLMQEAKALDIATGYFEVGAMVDLDSHWQTLEAIRVLMGDETSRSTRQALIKALEMRENGIEDAKETDDWHALEGLQAVKAAIAANHIQARVYTRDKFHAKAYHFKTGSVVNHGLIGSSNFTRPGLTRNLELNLFTSDNSQLNEVAKWYEKAWSEAEDINPDLLRIIEPHVREYFPFEIYVKAMRERFGEGEAKVETWLDQSELYKILATYQKDAYHDLLHMGTQWGGGLLCDGVGLGKTFVGLMLIEQALRKLRHRVLVIAPKAAIPSVWNRNLLRFFPDHFTTNPKHQHDIKVMPMTDFGRDGEVTDEILAQLHRLYDTIIIDEAHHFRAPYRNRSKKLRELTKDKRVFMLTATPVNNSLLDLYNLINYIAQDRQKHFQRAGVSNLRGWFRERMDEKDLDQMALSFSEDVDYEQFLKHVLVSRSRRYVKSLDEHDDPNVKFPTREKPEVIQYSLKEVYGGLLLKLLDAFHPKKAKLKLVIYETEKFKEKKEKDDRTLNEQSQVVSLIRTMLLKRLESSQKALEASVEDLLLKHVVLLKSLGQSLKFEAWLAENAELYDMLEAHRRARLGGEDEEEEDLPLTPYEVKKVEQVRADLKEFGKNEDAWLRGLEGDLLALTDLLQGLYEVTSPENDDKLHALIRKIESAPRLQRDRFVVFSEFKDTARYLETELKKRFPNDAIVEVDSGRHVSDREAVIKRFAPYYNCETDEEIEKAQKDPIRILISTDVLSEGLNLQDANIIVNYDLHWNPVRLMQRIGRVDRRMDPAKPVDYDKVYVYNFLPPDELEQVLGLFMAITTKLIAINRTLGIEAPVLTANDDFKAMDFYLNMGEAKLSPTEQLRLKALELERDHPELWKAAADFPNRVYSGKSSPSPWSEARGGRGRGMEVPVPSETANRQPPTGNGYLFLCYRVLTGYNKDDLENPEVYDTRWYLVNRESGEIVEDPAKVHGAIVCTEGTPRTVELPKEVRTEIRKKVESKEVAKAHFFGQVPQQVNGKKMKDILVCWMEVG